MSLSFVAQTLFWRNLCCCLLALLVWLQRRPCICLFPAGGGLYIGAIQGGMKCFHFLSGFKKRGVGVDRSRSTSVRSSSNISIDTGMMRSGSDPSSFESRNVSASDINVESMARTPGFSILQRTNNLRIFTFGELRSATKNFSRSVQVGEGGFGSVYRGMVKSTEDPHRRIEVAVKQLNRRGLQGHKEWLSEVTVLGIADHPNLVKLIGYCAEDDERGMQRLLVYEFMPNGSVEDHLHGHSRAPLSWSMRLKIALDAAEGLAYLHEGMDPQVGQIIFRDFKTSNILLDDEWNAKLSDFGMARQGPTDGLTHVSTVAVGTIGYSAPEYIESGHLNTKTDIWSYGVVLYELITGRLPVDKNRPRGEQKLLVWVKNYLNDAKKFRMILDPRLEGKYSLRSAHRLSKVASRCLLRNPKARPAMNQVLVMVREIVEQTASGDPQSPPVSISKELENGKHKKEKSKEGCMTRAALKRRITVLKAVDGWRLPWTFRPRTTAMAS